MDAHLTEGIFQTGSNTPFRQKEKFCFAWFVPVQGKISMAIWGIDILTWQWHGTGRAELYFLAGQSMKIGKWSKKK